MRAILPSFCSALFLTTPALARTLQFDWQPVEVCANTACPGVPYDEVLLRQILAQADLRINILPTIQIDDPAFSTATPGGGENPSLFVRERLRNQRPGVATSQLESPLVTWVLSRSAGRNVGFSSLALIGQSGALFVGGPNPNATFDTLTFARGITQNLGLVPNTQGVCEQNNVQAVVNITGCRIGPNLTQAQINTLRASRFVSPAAVPLPASFALLLLGLGTLNHCCRRFLRQGNA